MKKFFRIISYIKEYKAQMAWYSLFITLSIVFSLFSLGMLTPFLDLIFGKSSLSSLPVNAINASSIKDVIYGFLQNNIAKYGKSYALGWICLFIIVSIFLKNLFLYLSYYFLAPIRNEVTRKYSKLLYNKILALPIGYFTEQRKGDILSRSSNDIAELENSVVGALEGLIKEPLNIIGILLFLFFISFKLTLFVFVLLPIAGFVVGRIGRSLKKQTNKAQVKWGEILSQMEETLTGLRIIKGFNAEQKVKKQFYGLIDDIFGIKNRISYRRDLASPISEFLGVTILSGVLWFGGNLVLSGDILSPGSFITYVALFSQIINPAKALSQAVYNVNRGTATLDRLNEILEAPVTVNDIASPMQLNEFKDSITFENVGFSYQDDSILHNINLTVKKGKLVALVGSSGAGKSTLADLVPRFHDVGEGQLLIDGINIKNYSLHSLRKQISIVTQEPILFNDTIAANIALGKPEATEDEIIAAAKIANAYDFIIKKEGGFNSTIGDRGSKLSGGERQRLTIARAVLKNPPILILDEATSALDTESEKLVQDAINNMMQNRTSIVIAHRLSTIRHADEIILMQKGKIVERGNHETLLAQNGYYQKLIEMQEVK
ncbi:MAG: ABC transporter ATP-binding protein/permease [Sediminibacterium sp.]|jgi:ATP-binding cassette, subfamily B, bacterial MsbA|nr:ABC transporter ATP-binding protein/permease [Sediminibacterium sp.]